MRKNRIGLASSDAPAGQAAVLESLNAILENGAGHPRSALVGGRMVRSPVGKAVRMAGGMCMLSSGRAEGLTVIPPEPWNFAQGRYP